MVFLSTQVDFPETTRMLWPPCSILILALKRYNYQFLLNCLLTLSVLQERIEDALML